MTIKEYYYDDGLHEATIIRGSRQEIMDFTNGLQYYYGLSYRDALHEAIKDIDYCEVNLYYCDDDDNIVLSANYINIDEH